MRRWEETCGGETACGFTCVSFGRVCDADKHMISVNWLLNDEPLSVKDALALELADDLLVGNSAATLRKALTDSGLGESVIGGGLSSELLQNTYSIGLKVRSPKEKLWRCFREAICSKVIRLRTS